MISGALDEVAAGAGRVVVVEGPAGIGKTSLLVSARDAAQARNFAVAGARGSELELAYAWGVVRQLLEPRLRGMSGEERSRTLAGAAALAAPIVSPDGGVPAGDADPSFGVLHGLYRLVAGLAVGAAAAAGRRRSALGRRRRDSADAVTQDYPGTAPFTFPGGTIRRVAIDVSGEPYVDLEREAVAMMSRE